MQNGAKFPGIPAGIFLKTYSREFPNGNTWWAWLLFAVYCSPVADVIASHGVRYHQYAEPDDTQLHLAMRADNTDDCLSVLAACTTDVKQWYTQNGLQLNPDKPEVLLVGMTSCGRRPV